MSASPAAPEPSEAATHAAFKALFGREYEGETGDDLGPIPAALRAAYAADCAVAPLLGLTVATLARWLLEYGDELDDKSNMTARFVPEHLAAWLYARLTGSPPSEGL